MSKQVKNRRNKVETQTHSETQTGSGLTFSREEQRYLLSLAKQSIYEAILDKPYPIDKMDHTFPVLSEQRGLFVTLKIDGRLRGCIGNISPTEPLGELVKMIARQTAFDDPRFPPLSESELKLVSFEITVLGEMKLIEDTNELEVGRHGIMLKKGFYQGLLLPQVAVEMGWNRRQFLDGVCRKAGLPPGSWREKDVQIFLFTADYFGEAEVG